MTDTITRINKLEEQVVELLELCQRLGRSEEHTSELQSQDQLVCRLLLEKKNQTKSQTMQINHMKEEETRKSDTEAIRIK